MRHCFERINIDNHSVVYENKKIPSLQINAGTGIITCGATLLAVKNGRSAYTDIYLLFLTESITPASIPKELKLFFPVALGSPFKIMLSAAISPPAALWKES